jgi:hypothetical protein
MAMNLEADVALIHIAGGAARITSPPGTFAQTAPRRATRGRRDDLLFVNLSLLSEGSTPPGLDDHLGQLVAQAYYGTPGSVTFGLREAAAAVNDHILDLNEGEGEDSHHLGHMMVGILREKDLYLAQCGIGELILIRPGQVSRLSSEEAAKRPLGMSFTPHVSFHHLELHPSDIFILTSASPASWSESTLSGLSTLDPTQAVDRLVAASNQDMTGLLARIVPLGEAKDSLGIAEKPRPTPTDEPRSTERARRAPRSTRGTAQRTLGFIRQGLSGVSGKLGAWFTGFLQFLSNVLTRLAPGLAEPPPAGVFSTGLLAATAMAVPLIVVAISAVVYFGQGRREQFQEYLGQAFTSVQAARSKSDPVLAKGDWVIALGLLDKAENYGQSKEADELRTMVQDALDAIDLVVRLDFRPVVSGGFGPDATITTLAASTTDLYVLDSARRIIWHAWGTPERGYEIDKTFECLDGPNSFRDLDPAVDMVIQPEPGALGVEGMVAIDQDGTLLYCAPERQPAVAQLTPPDIGWGKIQAIDVFMGTLYVMDTEANAVYLYSAAGGFFSGNPELFFTEEVRDLSGAIDLTLAQDELIILYADGRLDRCRRKQEPTPEGSIRIRVECEGDLRFIDDRPGGEDTAYIPGAVPIEMDYSPPPEPSLFFLDSYGNRVFHYSMRLAYQGQYLPIEPFKGEISTLTLGPPNDLFIAVGDQVYHAKPSR